MAPTATTKKGSPPFEGSIAIIDPAVKKAELEAFNELARMAPCRMSYHLPGLFGVASLNQLVAEPSGIILMGSASSVHDHLPWQKELETWLRPRIEAKIPVLGICFGHQFIASLYGGEVGFLHPDRRHRKGSFELSLSRHPLLSGESKKGFCLSSHQEIVSKCPRDFDVLGSSDAVAIEALGHKVLPVWTFQCHPEATKRFLKTRCGGEPLDERALEFGRTILRGFFKLVS